MKKALSKRRNDFKVRNLQLSKALKTDSNKDPDKNMRYLGQGNTNLSQRLMKNLKSDKDLGPKNLVLLEHAQNDSTRKKENLSHQDQANTELDQ